MVIVSATHWTKAGACDNDENTLILHDRELARAYHAEWQRLWATVKHSTPPTPKLAPSLPTRPARRYCAGRCAIRVKAVAGDLTITLHLAH